MWIISTRGFLSIVEDRKNPAMMQVRARVKSDITDMFPAAYVYASDGADYRYRARISRERVAARLAEYVQNELTYTGHFKDVAIARERTKDPKLASKRTTAYYKIWNAMADLQDFRPYSYMNREQEAVVEDARRRAAKPMKFEPRRGEAWRDYDDDGSDWGRDDLRYSWERDPSTGKFTELTIAEVLDADTPQDLILSELFTEEELQGVRDAYDIEPETADLEKVYELVEELHRQHYFAQLPKRRESVYLEDDDYSFYRKTEPEPKPRKRRNRRRRNR